MKLIELKNNQKYLKNLEKREILENNLRVSEIARQKGTPTPSVSPTDRQLQALKLEVDKLKKLVMALMKERPSTRK